MDITLELPEAVDIVVVVASWSCGEGMRMSMGSFGFRMNIRKHGE